MSRSSCLRAALLLCLAALPGCVGDSGGRTLYVYDNASSSVQAWADVDVVYQAAAAGTAVAAPDRTILSSLYSSITLAWDGLALDSNRNLLYLVSEGGTVYVITKAATQDGSISATTDITSFALGEATDRYSAGSVFGQAAVDASDNILYVMETAKDGSGSRVWKVTGASGQVNGNSLTPAASYTFGISSDTYGAGLAAVPGGGVYGLFGGGSAVYSSTETYTGPRLRLGPAGSFVAPNVLGVSSDVLIGGDTLLANPMTYGSLGYDAQNRALYVFGGPATSSTAILVFNAGEFSLGGFDQAPARSLGDSAADLASLRILSHPANSDWMLGANATAVTGTTGTGQATLFIWKAPSEGGAAIQAALPETTAGAVQIRGMAIGGND